MKKLLFLLQMKSNKFYRTVLFTERFIARIRMK